MGIIRKAAPGDYEALVSLAKDFTAESGLPLTFSAERARETLWASMHHPEIDFLVEYDEVLTGAMILTYENNYYDETCAYVEKFFVHREFRGRGTSDNLLRAMIPACEARNAKLIFASATAGMGERIEKLYVRLFERHGFTVLGRIIMRRN